MPKKQQKVEKWEVEKILNHTPKSAKSRDKVKAYHVKWKHYSLSDSTWENAKVKHQEIPILVDQYWDRISKIKDILGGSMPCKK